MAAVRTLPRVPMRDRQGSDQPPDDRVTGRCLRNRPAQARCETRSSRPSLARSRSPRRAGHQGRPAWAGAGHQPRALQASSFESEIVLGVGAWLLILKAVPAASGVVSSRGPERVARALPSAGIEGGWSTKRPYSARGRRDFFGTQGASKPAVPAGQLPEGAGVVMPPGPVVPFPGAWGTFPQTRRPAARPHPRPPSRPGPQAGRTLGL
jgi:hypothetical protein